MFMRVLVHCALSFDGVLCVPGLIAIFARCVAAPPRGLVVGSGLAVRQE